MPTSHLTTTYQGRDRTLFIPVSPGRTITVTKPEDPRIEIVQDWALALSCNRTADAAELLAKLDAAPKLLEPLAPHCLHDFDERCAECVPQES